MRIFNSLCISGAVFFLASSAASAMVAERSDVAPVGQKISLDLKGVDIVDVLKLLSQKGGLNFVAGRNVTGRVTIFAKDVDIWNAFQLIVEANDLAYEVHDDLINVMTARDYEVNYGKKFQEPTLREVVSLDFAQAVQVATVLNQVKSAIGRVVADEPSNTLVLIDIVDRIEVMQDIIERLDRPTKTLVRQLNYSKGDVLQDKVLEMLTPIGTYTHDERTNKVVVSDLPEVVEKVERLLGAFDTPDPQVSIESRILSVTLTDDYNLGIDWQQVFNGVDTETRTNFRVLSDIVGESATAKGGALQLITSPKEKTTLIVEALRTIGETETLSNPRIMVSNNQEAKILVGTKEATVSVTTTVPSTGTVVTSPEIQYVDVGTQLFVTPSIKDDGHVMLKIKPEVSTARIETFADNRIPIVTTTEAETTVLVKSGVTLIIGGLIETSDAKTVNKLPILGDIPFLGKAFQGTTDAVDRSELVVFITPQIVNPDGSEVLPPIKAVDVGYETANPDQPLPLGYRAEVRTELQDRVYADLMANNMPEGSAVLNFVLNNKGEVVRVIEVYSPQGEDYEAVVAQSIEGASFPPFPPTVPLEEIRFKMAVEYTPLPLGDSAEPF